MVTQVGTSFLPSVAGKLEDAAAGGKAPQSKYLSLPSPQARCFGPKATEVYFAFCSPQ